MRWSIQHRFGKTGLRLLGIAAAVGVLVLGYVLAVNLPLNKNWLFAALIACFFALSSVVRPPHSR